MIDWNKERTSKNYCGNCVVDAMCTGECFKKDENKLDHLETERSLLQQRGQAIGQEFKKLLNPVK